MEPVIEILKNLDISQLIAMGIMLWVFYSRLNSKTEILDQKLTSKIDKLDEKLTDIDRRVCRIEGSLNSKECCMLKDSRTKEKID